MSANFTPTMGDYTELKPFRFWCQKVLPLVYDDTLSYYELLCKVVNYLNMTMEDVDTLHTDVENLHTAYGQLQNYVNDYFSNLDVQQEINSKLDAMASSGELTTLIAPTIVEEVEDWLEEHITPTTPAIDNTLSVSGAGADAKVTGDLIKGLTTALDTNNIESQASVKNKYVTNDGTLANNTALRCSDYITIPKNAIGVKMYCRYYHSAESPANLFYPLFVIADETKTNFTPISTNTSGVTEDDNHIATFMFNLGEGLSDTRYLRFNQSNKTEDLSKYYFEFIVFSFKDILYYAKNLSVANTPNLNYTNGIDVHSLDVNKIYARNEVTSGIQPVHLPYNDWTGILFVLSCTPSSTSGRFYFAIDSNNDVYIKNSWGVPTAYSDWVKLYDENDGVILDGLVGRYVGAFESHHQQITTSIKLTANETYVIRAITRNRKEWTIFGLGDASNFEILQEFDDYIKFTNGNTDRYLCLYNYGSSQSDTSFDSINIEVYKENSAQLKLFSVPKVYTVNKLDNRGNYTSLTQCLWDLKDDFDPKIIIVEEGDYDIYDEYTSLKWVDINSSTGEPYERTGFRVYEGNNPSTEYFDYCVWIPKNTHIIGKGIVRLIWSPNPSTDSITPNQCKCVSPLNAVDNCTIENVEVYCKNGRYALHNDGLGKKKFFGARQKYINCKFYKYINDKDGNNVSYGYTHTVGFGIDRGQNHLYSNCTFMNYQDGHSFYGHSRLTTIANNNQSPNITLLNCVIERIQLLKCTTAIPTPSSWNGANWGNAIPDMTVKEKSIYAMLNSATNFSSANTYDVGDVIFGTNSEPIVKLGNSATNTPNTQIRVLFNSDYIHGLIHSMLESGTGNCKNAFDMQFLNCGSVSVKISDSDNDYPVKGYNTEVSIS